VALWENRALIGRRITIDRLAVGGGFGRGRLPRRGRPVVLLGYRGDQRVHLGDEEDGRHELVLDLLGQVSEAPRRREHGAQDLLHQVRGPEHQLLEGEAFR